MQKQGWPEWLLNLHLQFREDDEEEGDDEEDEGDEDEENDDDAEDGDDEESDDDKDKDGKSKAKSKKGTKDDDFAELKKSLREERKLRRKAERDARQARAASTDKEKREEAEETAQKLQASEERTAKLAKRLRKSEVERAILAAATDANFIDPTDALVDAVIKNIDVDQDEDDPSDIDVDLDSVEEAVKEYARKKKHLVGEGVSKVKSGSKQKRKKGDSDKPNEQKLQSTYPSLRD